MQLLEEIASSKFGGKKQILRMHLRSRDFTQMYSIRISPLSLKSEEDADDGRNYYFQIGRILKTFCG